ncbi:monocarboxylate transporter 10 isoform X2 [Athalia rosae]|uniref:monocarboxylate transporter 10 isoform X2 n=1 Tax=Athalia rosae TaxID=37344 RepID=UPI002033D5F0|nr:monocarboxylate transporter 10 isoform X2 [Athalia rosae]
MTVTKSSETKQESTPDLTYNTLQGARTQIDGENRNTRVSSEEPILRNESSSNNNNDDHDHQNESHLHTTIIANPAPPIVQEMSLDAEVGAPLIRPQDWVRNAPQVLRSNSEDDEVVASKKKDPEDPGHGDILSPEYLLATNNASRHEPPDGGVRAWSVMVASFFINGVLFGIINAYSVVYIKLQAGLQETGDTEASSKAALVGSLTIGTTFLLSPIAGILTDKIGIRLTTFIGGALASGGMLLSSLLYDKVEALFVTYGVMYGLGASLAYTPSLVILGHYFKKYLGFVNGVVTAGSSVFTILMPYLMSALLKHVGLAGLLQCLAGLTAVVMGCSLLFKPVLPPPPPNIEDSRLRKTSLKTKLKEVINVSIWKQKRYVLWAGAIPIALFGYFVPYIHFGKFIKSRFVGASENLPVVCIGITSGLGRLIFGYIADLPRINRMLLQQISFISIGVLTMLLPLTHSFEVILAISLGMGLFDGCFISLLGPIAFDICGRKGATQAIGFLLGMCSIPLTIGPPVAGVLFDHTGSYDLAFYLAGIPPICGALAMFLIRCVDEERSGRGKAEPINQTRHPIAQNAWQNGINRAEEELWNGKFVYPGTKISSLYCSREDCNLNDFYRNFERYKVRRCVQMANNITSRYSESEPLLFGCRHLRGSYPERNHDSSSTVTILSDTEKEQLVIL